MAHQGSAALRGKTCLVCGGAGFMQAYAPAWSGGRNDDPSGIADIIQYKNGLTVGGVNLDMSIVQTAARMWRLG